MTRTDPPPRRSRSPEGGKKAPPSETRSVTPHTEDLDTGWEEEDQEAVDVALDGLDIPVDDDQGEITTGETEVSLDELGLGPDLEPGDDPCPSPFDRPTIVPPIPEREYVAQMMGELPENERLPASRSLTPQASLPVIPQSKTPALGIDSRDLDAASSRPTKMPDPISSRPTPVDAMSPVLTLDLSDPIQPGRA